MNTKYFFCLIALVIISIPVFTFAQGNMPFGGSISSIQTCNSGMLLYVTVPMKGMQQFMWNWGELPYNMHVIPHVQQNLLGMAGSSQTSQCWLGKEHIADGYPIQFHGDSY